MSGETTLLSIMQHGERRYDAICESLLGQTRIGACMAYQDLFCFCHATQTNLRFIQRLAQIGQGHACIQLDGLSKLFNVHFFHIKLLFFGTVCGDRLISSSIHLHKNKMPCSLKLK